MEKNKFYDLTDAYMDDTLDGPAREEFERALSSDPALRRHVEQTALLADALTARAEREMLGAAGASGTTPNISTGGRKSANLLHRDVKLWVRWSWVAAMLVVAGLWYGATPEYSTGRLYDTYFDPAAFDALPRRGEGATEPELLVMQAAGAIADGRTGEARAIIDRLLADFSDPEAAGDALWLKACLLLNEANRRGARDVLEEIISGGGYYAPQAARLLEDLQARKWF